MHYYQFNISYFSQNTKHLSIIERGIYRELLDLYYDKETPLVNNPERLARLICASEYLTDVEQVLNEYFTLVDNEWVNDTCEKVISEYQKRLNTASKAGKASAKARATKLKASKEVTPVEQPLNDGATNYKLETNNHKPITSKQDKIPYQLIADVYNESFSIPTNNPSVVKLTNPRKAAIKKLWTFDTENPIEEKRTNTVDYFKGYLAHCATIKFFQASTERTGDFENWHPDFDFMMKEKTFIGVKERKYK